MKYGNRRVFALHLLVIANKKIIKVLKIIKYNIMSQHFNRLVPKMTSPKTAVFANNLKSR